jgi:hypothetical protein
MLIYTIPCGAPSERPFEESVFGIRSFGRFSERCFANFDEKYVCEKECFSDFPRSPKVLMLLN